MLNEEDLDVFLDFGNNNKPDLVYASEFRSSDNFAFLFEEDHSMLLVPTLDKNLARKSSVDEIRCYGEFEEGDIRENTTKQIQVIDQLLNEIDAESIGVPNNFDAFVVKYLVKNGYEVELVNNPVKEARQQKNQKEIEFLKNAQNMAESGMKYCKKILSESKIDAHGFLKYQGEKLTSVKLRNLIRKYLIEVGCNPMNYIITAGGTQSAIPHESGTNPLKTGEPIIVDIVLQEENGYFGDMTRTFVKGKPKKEIINMYKATLESYKESLRLMDEGGSNTPLKTIHNKACEVFENYGYKTINQGDIEEGFIHSLGHSIGTEVHESPRINNTTNYKTQVGNVFTIEPGLYNPNLGGVRIEDMIVVENKYIENINKMDTRLFIV